MEYELEPLYAALGRRLRMRRESLGLSLGQMAQKAEMPVAVIGAYERADRRASIAQLYRMADALDCNPRLLLPGDDTEESPIPDLLTAIDAGTAMIADVVSKLRLTT